jgi:hypothetical protein
MSPNGVFDHGQSFALYWSHSLTNALRLITFYDGGLLVVALLPAFFQTKYIYKMYIQVDVWAGKAPIRCLLHAHVHYVAVLVIKSTYTNVRICTGYYSRQAAAQTQDRGCEG